MRFAFGSIRGAFEKKKKRKLVSWWDNFVGSVLVGLRM